MMLGETKLGYKITELIGQGGFGTVYKAVKKNKAMETVRALKHISLPSRKQWTDIYNSMGNDMVKTDEYFDTILQEILNEIRILADLTNKGVKNVVWYYENEIEDTPSPKHYDIYLLMEYLTALPSYIETHQFKVKDVIKVGTDILSALIECHKRKIIHRDIKSDNIFISDDGDYKLGDFGVSKKLSDRSRATSMKGTPNYIAPEIYLGQAYDETVDLYSLGIVLYRLLNYNRNPFMPDYPVSFDSVDEDKAFELRMKGEKPKYPAFAQGELGDVILKSISDKENRYKSAKEFKDALEKAAKNMTEEELNTVVIEDVLSGVDFSTFGSKNELTQMADDNVSDVKSNSVSNINNNSVSFSKADNSNDINVKSNKSKIIIPIAIVLILAICGGVFFLLNNKQEKEGRFVQVDGYTKFMKKNGEYAQNEWIFFDNNEYYFNGRQTLVTNDTIDFNGKTYYVNKDGEKIINDWYKSNDGKEYYLDENGEPIKNTAKNINDEVVFFNEKGEKVKNDWFLYNGDYYFLDSEGVMLKDTFKNMSSTDWYYLGSDGKMLKNTLYDVNGQTYFFDVDGKMKIDALVSVGSSVYYAQENGIIKKDGWCLNNQYYADKDGKILMNTTTPDGVKVDETGKRIKENTYVPETYDYTKETTKYNKENNNNYNNNYNNYNQETTVAISGKGTTIKNGSVSWGDHLKHTETFYLDEYGEEGGVGKVSIDIMKLKEDGTEEVANVNATIQQIYNAAVERAQFEMPYKYFELEKTTCATSNDTMLVLLMTGEIKYTDNQKENMRYKLTLDRASATVSYEKVR